MQIILNGDNELKNKSKIMSSAERMLYPFGTIMPVALCMFVCSGIGAINAIPVIIFLSLIAKKSNFTSVFPIYLNFLIVTYIYNGFGGAATTVAIIISGLLTCFAEPLTDKIKDLHSSPAVSAIMLTTALTITIMQTTAYFGIGATGNTAREMIFSYVSLGFHPNWRGVLYGTIAMVIMITFPRKFKKFSKIIHPSFFAIIITLILNYFLNPSDSITAITEIGNSEFNSLISFNTSEFLDLMTANLISVTMCGFALFISNIFLLSSDKMTEKYDYLAFGAMNIPLSLFGGFMPSRTLLIKPADIFKVGIPALVAASVAIAVFSESYTRIPVHTCAVILIVGAWQSVEWKKIKNTFSNDSSVVCFVAVTIISLVFGIVFGVVFAGVAAVINSIIIRKKIIDF